MKNAGRIAKYIVTFIVFFLCGLFILRCCFAADHSTLSDITPTDRLKTAYAAQDGDVDILTHSIVSEISQDGYMTVYAFVYIPSIEQIQLTVRYNDSIFDYNNLSQDTAFTFILQDSESGAAIPASIVQQEKKLMYNYLRLVFDGVTIGETNDLVLHMLAGDAEISSDTVHYADQNVVMESYRLSRGEKKLLT